MEYRSIGSLQVSAVGLGCNNFGPRLDAAGAERVVLAALDAGVTLFDTATLYGSGKSEEYLGRALRLRRSEAVIASKAGHSGEGPGRGGSPDYLRHAVDASLQRLAVDQIDLYQLHQPDPATPIAETLGAFSELRDEGKIREFGCSNFSADQLREANEAGNRRKSHFVSVQNEFSLIHPDPEDDGVLDVCRELGIAFIPYFPLASGLLTGKYRKGAPRPEGTRLGESRRAGLLSDANLDFIERLVTYAEARGHTLLELAFGWLLSHDRVVSVIAGAMTPEQLKANSAAAGWALTAAQLAEVRALAHPAGNQP